MCNQKIKQALRSLVAMALSIGAFTLVGCGPMPMGGRYEGSFSQTVQVRETLFQSEGNSTIAESEISLVQDGPLMIAVGIDVDAVLEGLACPSIPLMFREGDLVLERGVSCEARSDSDLSDGQVRRRETKEVIEIDDVEVIEVDSGLIEVSAEIKRKFEVVLDGRRTQTIEEEVSLTFDGVLIAPAKGAF